MNQLAQQTLRACQELSSLFNSGTQSDAILYQVELIELSLLRERINRAIADNDHGKLKECLDECQRLRARDQAMRRVLTHSSYTLPPNQAR